MSYVLLCCLAALLLLAVALLAAERALRPGHPLGIPAPPQRTTKCQRCGRNNLEAGPYGSPLPHYPHSRADRFCQPRRLH